MKIPFARLLGIVGLLLSIAGPALAQVPSSVKIIVGSPPGGSNDVLARIVGDRLGKLLNVTVIVDNISGASGAIGQAKVIAAAPDGATLLLASVNDVLVDVMAGTQKVQHGLVPVGGIASVPFVLVGRPTLQATSIDELVRMARQPGSKMTIGAAGTGTFSHLAAELVQREMNVRMTYAPYKGSTPALTDVMGGHLDLSMVGLASVMPHLKAGTLRVYGLFSTRRSPLAPDVPTLLEGETLKSMKPFNDPWVGLMLPAKTSPEIQLALSAALAKAVASEDVQQQIRNSGAVPAAMTAEEMQRVIRADTTALAAVVKASNIKTE